MNRRGARSRRRRRRRKFSWRNVNEILAPDTNRPNSNSRASTTSRAAEFTPPHVVRRPPSRLRRTPSKTRPRRGRRSGREGDRTSRRARLARTGVGGSCFLRKTHATSHRRHNQFCERPNFEMLDRCVEWKRRVATSPHRASISHLLCHAGKGFTDGDSAQISIAKWSASVRNFQSASTRGI